jgi:uncharacterized protein (TIGR02444 family)
LSTPDLRAWAEARYAEPGVAEACLQLQDEHGVDVLLLLTAAWLDAAGRRLDAATAATLREAAADWAARVVTPLRGARRVLKRDPPAGATAALADLARQIAAVELAAERVALATLGRIAADLPTAGPGPSAALLLVGAAAATPEAGVVLAVGSRSG